jgi:hypothetical protein
MSHTTIVFDRRAGLLAAIEKAAQECAQEAAYGLRDTLRDSIGGEGPLNSDTGALREGLYVQHREGDDFAERRSAAQSAYTDEGGMWPDIVREHITEQAYTPDHFEERAASDVEPLPLDALAAVCEMMAYGWFWQMGHFNVLTENWEQRSWFIEPVMRWFQAEAETYFSKFVAKVEDSL